MHMTAITYFYTDEGKKLIVVSDRQVTHESELREKEKVLKKGRFFIFCAGSEDIYLKVLGDVNSNRTSIKRLARFMRNKVMKIMEERGKIGMDVSPCEFVIIDSINLNAFVIIRGTDSPALDFGIVGSGEKYVREVNNIFSRLVPTGFQLRSIRFSDTVYSRILEAYDTLAYKDPYIGHPALFGLNIYVFQKRRHKNYKLRFNHDVRDFNSYGGLI